jgi:MFS family permease
VGKKLGNTFSSLNNRNYALFFCGQSISQIGTWMQRTAVSWVVYTMTQSAFMLGLAVFAQQFPSFVFSLLGGIAADRYNRYKILLLTQIASMVQAILLAVLTLSGNYSVTGILLLSVMLGVVNAFDLPARQPLVHELVKDKSEVPNALALNASMVNLARLVGPALSGLALEFFGAGICFLINAFSFVAVLTSLLLMKLPAYTRPVGKKNVFTEFSEGFRYIKETPAIAVALIMMASSALLVWTYDTLIPVFAKVVFHGDATTYGYISAFGGLGAIAGTLFLASLREKNHNALLLINTIVLGVGLIFFSQITYFPLAMLFMVLMGFGAMSQTTLCLTIIQLQAEAKMRGRVMSYVGMAYFGMLPLGSLLVGTVSHEIGADNTLLIQGVAAVLIALLFYIFLSKRKKQSIQTQ